MKIDLHGVRHNEVRQKIDIFFWDAIRNNKSQIEIITGNSEKMKKIIFDICDEYKFEVNKLASNSGKLVVYI